MNGIQLGMTALLANLACLSGAARAEAPVPITHGFFAGFGGAEGVAQDDPRGAEIEAVLAGIALPPGFRIGLYALVPGARHIAVAPDGLGIAFVGTTGDRLWALQDADADGRAERVQEFAPGIGFVRPNGPCFAPDGTLYLAERNRVFVFPDAAAQAFAQEPPAFDLVAEGALIPPDEVGRSHLARVCRIGPDDRLYVSIGQPYNVSPPGKQTLYDETGIGGIIRMNRDGSGREVHTRGIRNSVGHDFHPVTGELWFTDNQVDGMGDDIPPGELNRQTAPGQHFGFPWYGGGLVRTHEYLADTPPADAVAPVIEMIAHAADLGMRFYTGTAFPEAYQGAIFSAQHGSWDRSEPVGARVMVTYPDAPGGAWSEALAEGWIAADGSYLGRPVDVEILPDGSILVTDDHADAVYRIWYEGE